MNGDTLKLIQNSKDEIFAEVRTRLNNMHLSNKHMHPKLSLGLCGIIRAVMIKKFNFYASTKEYFDILGLPWKETNNTLWWHPTEYKARYDFLIKHEPLPF